MTLQNLDGSDDQIELCVRSVHRFIHLSAFCITAAAAAAAHLSLIAHQLSTTEIYVVA